MIGRMKKITVICIREHQEASLLALQQLGVLHLEHVVEPGGNLLEETREHHQDACRACEVLENYAQLQPAGTASRSETPRPADEVVDEIWKWLNLRKDREDERDHWQRELARLAPYGAFDPAAIEQLAAKGIYVGCFKAGPKAAIKVPDDMVLTVHQQDRNGIYFSVIAREPIELPYDAVRLPDRSLAAIQQQLAQTEETLANIERELEALAPYLPKVREIIAETEDKLRFLEARTGMATVEPLAYLRGYAPEREVAHIQAAAAKLGWGLLIEDVKEEDRVPTKIENPRWVQPIRAVFDFIGVVPGYNEVDISGVFLLFFSLFFAMIVGDAGYGALFIAATVAAQFKWRQLPASVFHLLYITGIATLVWGVLTGNYFGIEAIPGVLGAVRVDWLLTTENVMLLCFVIGAVHLTIAHGWNVVRLWPRTQAWAQIGWIGIVWTMFFLARFLVLNADFPVIMWPVFAVGLVLLVLFMTPFARLKTDWIDHVMLPLNLVSNFVDVVSYVRLFAVGTATLAVASAFNDMGLEIGAGGGIGTVFAVLIIFLGHTLNILLAAMGVLVHGIRLNTLEFAGHVGLQWTGEKYNPFRIRSRRGPLVETQPEETAS